MVRNCTESEGETVRRAGKFAYSRTFHSCSPGHCTAQNPVFAHYFGYSDFRKPVLKGHYHSVRGKIVFQESHHFPVVLLLGHQENDVVLSAHLAVGDGCDLLGELHCTHHPGTVFIQSLHVRLIVVDEVYLSPIFRDESSQNSAQGTGTVYCCSRHNCEDKYPGVGRGKFYLSFLSKILILTSASMMFLKSSILTLCCSIVSR